MNLELMISFFLKDLHTKQRTPTIVEDSYTSSPYGELVFKTMKILAWFIGINLGFPSPYGVLVFKTRYFSMAENTVEVSVPLRGVGL